MRNANEHNTLLETIFFLKFYASLIRRVFVNGHRVLSAAILEKSPSPNWIYSCRRSPRKQSHKSGLFCYIIHTEGWGLPSWNFVNRKRMHWNNPTLTSLQCTCSISGPTTHLGDKRLMPIKTHVIIPLSLWLLFYDTVSVVLNRRYYNPEVV